MSSVWHIRPKPGEAAASLGAVLLERQVPVWRRALPEGPHRGIFLLLLHAGSFALAQRFLQEAQTAAAPRWALTPHGGGHPAVRRGGPGAGRYLRGGGAGALPGAAGGVIVPPAGAGRQLPVRVVVVEGVAQPAAVPPLPPVILARPRRLRGDRGESAGTGSAPPEPLGALRFPPAPLTLQLPPPAMLLPPTRLRPAPARARDRPAPPPGPRVRGCPRPGSATATPPSREISTAGTRWVSRNLYSRIQAATEERAEFGGLTRPPAPPGVVAARFLQAGLCVLGQTARSCLSLRLPSVSYNRLRYLNY